MGTEEKFLTTHVEAVPVALGLDRFTKLEMNTNTSNMCKLTDCMREQQMAHYACFIMHAVITQQI